MTLESMYRKERALGFRAQTALANARTRLAWSELAGVTTDQYAEDIDGETCSIRLRIVVDEDIHDDSYLDTWDMSEQELARTRAELHGRLNDEGLWGVVGEYWDGGKWEQADSCYGFIGGDWLNSGYDTDIMAEVMFAYSEYVSR